VSVQVDSLRFALGGISGTSIRFSSDRYSCVTSTELFRHYYSDNFDKAKSQQELQIYSSNTDYFYPSTPHYISICVLISRLFCPVTWQSEPGNSCPKAQLTLTAHPAASRGVVGGALWDLGRNPLGERPCAALIL